MDSTLMVRFINFCAITKHSLEIIILINIYRWLYNIKYTVRNQGQSRPFWMIQRRQDAFIPF
jgi:hypothetical protein